MVERLIILNCPIPRAYLHLVCTNSKQLLASWRWFAAQTPYLGEVILQAQDYSGVVNLLKKSMKNKQNFTDSDSDYYKYVFSKHGLTAPLNFFRAIPSLLDTYSFNTGIVKPKTLIIWGATNDSIIVDGAYHSKAYCRDAELTILPNGRNLQIDEPQTVNRRIEEFLNKP